MQPNNHRCLMGHNINTPKPRKWHGRVQERQGAEIEGLSLVKLADGNAPRRLEFV